MRYSNKQIRAAFEKVAEKTYPVSRALTNPIPNSVVGSTAGGVLGGILGALPGLHAKAPKKAKILSILGALAGGAAGAYGGKELASLDTKYQRLYPIIEEDVKRRAAQGGKFDRANAALWKYTPQPAIQRRARQGRLNRGGKGMYAFETGAPKEELVAALKNQKGFFGTKEWREALKKNVNKRQKPVK